MLDTIPKKYNPAFCFICRLPKSLCLMFQKYWLFNLYLNFRNSNFKIDGYIHNNTGALVSFEIFRYFLFSVFKFKTSICLSNFEKLKSSFEFSKVIIDCLYPLFNNYKAKLKSIFSEPPFFKFGITCIKSIYSLR